MLEYIILQFSIQQLHKLLIKLSVLQLILNMQ